ncbi:MAG: hypothetical protein JJU10_05530 [Idiomarina sp.]|nr:hypothetical protein [Idiomarina sp.]
MRWIKAIVYILLYAIGYREERKRDERHESIENDPDSEWGRRFGSVQQPDSSATANESTDPVQDRTSSPGDKTSRRGDLDEQSKSD